MVGIMEINWQDLLTIALAGTCSAWVAWTTLRPFVRKVASACGMCSGCGPEKGAAPSNSVSSQTGPDDLLQIAPTES